MRSVFLNMAVLILLLGCGDFTPEKIPVATGTSTVFDSIDKSNLKVVHVAGIDWCPLICKGTGVKNPGFLAEIMRKAFEARGIEVKLYIFPWSRAILHTRNGQVDGLLAPVKKEAPDLLYPQRHLGIQRSCFYTRRIDAWRYKGEASLLKRKVLFPQDSSFEELKGFVSRHPEIFKSVPYSVRYHDFVFNEVAQGRRDTILGVDYALAYAMDKRKIQGLYKSAGCVGDARLFLAFSASGKNQKRSEFFRKEFDRGMDILIKKNLISGIMRKYGFRVRR